MTVRPANEIQRAHDLLVPILIGELKLLMGEETRKALHAACDVLCWVLNHDHNQAFADNLRKVEEAAAAKGFRLLDHGN